MKTVVILLSDKRSGSTMLQSELCKHASIRSVEYSSHTYSETQHWLKSAVLVEQHPSMFNGGITHPNYGSRAKARMYLIDTIKGNVEDFDARVDDESLIFDGWEAICQKYSQPVFFEKSPQILAHWAALELFLQWVDRTSLNVKIIGLVRHPLAVLSSARKLFGTHPSERQFTWIQAQKNLLVLKSILPSTMFKILRYEDLIADASVTMTELFDFIGVDVTELPHLDVHDGSLTKWKSDTHVQFPLDSATRRVAAAFDYSSESMRPTAASELSPNSPTRLEALARWPHMLRNRLVDRVIKPARIKKKWDL